MNHNEHTYTKYMYRALLKTTMAARNIVEK